MLSFIDKISYISNKDFFKGINKKTVNCVDRYFELEPFFVSKSKKTPKLSLENFRETMIKPLKDISVKELKLIAKMYYITISGTKKELVKRLERLRGLQFKK